MRSVAGATRSGVGGTRSGAGLTGTVSRATAGLGTPATLFPRLAELPFWLAQTSASSVLAGADMAPLMGAVMAGAEDGVRDTLKAGSTAAG